MKACILMKVNPGKHNEVAAQVKGLEGVKFAFPTLGRQDVVVNLEFKSIQDLSFLISRIQAIDHVRGTETLIAMEG